MLGFVVQFWPHHLSLVPPSGPPTIDRFGVVPSMTAAVHKRHFRPVSSREPGLKHAQVAAPVKASVISVK